MATGGSNFIVQVLTYRMTSDILTGFLSIPFKTMSQSTIPEIVSDNIVRTLVNVEITDKEGAEFASLSVEDQQMVFTTSIAFAVGEFYMFNMENITDSPEKFMTDIINLVPPKLQSATPDPALTNISKKEVVEVAVSHAGNSCLKYKTRGTHLTIVIIILLIVIMMFIYYFYCNKNSK